MKTAKALIATVGGNAPSHCTDCTISFDAQTIDVTTKSTAEGANDEEVTTKSATLNFKQYIDTAEATPPYLVGSTYNVACQYDDDDSAVTFAGICTSVNESAPTTGKATRDVTIKSQGPLTFS